MQDYSNEHKDLKYFCLYPVFQVLLQYPASYEFTSRKLPVFPNLLCMVDVERAEACCLQGIFKLLLLTLLQVIQAI